jgi:hypothetical protein
MAVGKTASSVQARSLILVAVQISPNRSWTSNCLPSGSVSRRPAAIKEPSRAGHTCIDTELEIEMESLPSPLCAKLAGPPISTFHVMIFPAAPFTSTESEDFATSIP